MIDAYARSRPPGAASRRVAIVANEADLPPDQSAILLAKSVDADAKGELTVAAGPITQNVDWSAFPTGLRTTAESPKGWTPVLTVGNRVIVAALAEPQRRVWIGFEPPSAWSATADFVIFWANVFSWLGQGKENLAFYPLMDYDPQWKWIEPMPRVPAPDPGQWPGVYRREDGAPAGV